MASSCCLKFWGLTRLFYQSRVLWQDSYAFALFPVWVSCSVRVTPFRSKAKLSKSILPANIDIIIDVSRLMVKKGPPFSNRLIRFWKLLILGKVDKELLTAMDIWMYLLKPMSTLDRIPTFLDKPVFQLIFNLSEVAKLRKEECENCGAGFRFCWLGESSLSLREKISESF